METALALRLSTASLEFSMDIDIPGRTRKSYPNSRAVTLAEFRGPGTRRQWYDSPDDYDMDMDHRTRTIGGRAERVILLGDGTEVLSDSLDNELLEQDEPEPRQNDPARNADAGPSQDASADGNRDRHDSDWKAPADGERSAPSVEPAKVESNEPTSQSQVPPSPAIRKPALGAETLVNPTGDTQNQPKGSDSAEG